MPSRSRTRSSSSRWTNAFLCEQSTYVTSVVSCERASSRYIFVVVTVPARRAAAASSRSSWSTVNTSPLRTLLRSKSRPATPGPDDACADSLVDPSVGVCPLGARGCPSLLAAAQLVRARVVATSWTVRAAAVLLLVAGDDRCVRAMVRRLPCARVLREPTSSRPRNGVRSPGRALECPRFTCRFG